MHTYKRRRVARVCVTWYVACINGTRRGLRMTLSGKCSGLCIVIPVEYRRWRLYHTYIRTYIRAQSFPIHLVLKPTPSKPISYFLRFFAISTPIPPPLSRVLDEARARGHSDALFRSRCGRDSDDHSSIKSNNDECARAAVIRYAFA